MYKCNRYRFVAHRHGAALKLGADTLSHRLQSLRRAVNSRTDADRSCAQNRGGVVDAGRCPEPAGLIADLPDSRAVQPGTVGKHANRKTVIIHADDMAVVLRLCLGGEFDPMISAPRNFWRINSSIWFARGLGSIPFQFQQSLDRQFRFLIMLPPSTAWAVGVVAGPVERPYRSERARR
jgi:hypothetical protein